MNDFRFAFRTLSRNPGFAAVAVVVLGLGIALTTTVFSVVEGTLLRSLPFPGADRLVDIKSIPQEYRGRGIRTSPLTAFEAWRSEHGVVEDMAAYLAPGDPVYMGSGGPVRLRAWTVTANLFGMFGATPRLGRLFLAEDDRPGSAPVALLSHRLWTSEFGANPGVVGRGITLDTTTYTVVGVLPPGFEYPSLPQFLRSQAGTDVWLGLGSLLSGPSGPRWAERPGWWIIARLRPGVTPEAAEARLDIASHQWWERDPSSNGLVPVVQNLHAHLTGDVGKPLLLMLGAVFLVLVVACANVGSLLASRVVSRGPEMAVRAALGAQRARLLRQVMIETVVLALGAGALGLLLSQWSLPLLLALAGPELPSVARISINPWVLTAAVGTSLGAGLVTGLIPALQLSRRETAELLKTGGGPGSVIRARGSHTGGRFLAGQVAVSVVLLSGAGLLVQSFARLVRVDLGFDAGSVLAAELRLPDERYRSGEERLAFAQMTLERLRALPGVTAVAAASAHPMRGGSVGSVSIPGRTEQPQTPAWFAEVTPDYFRALGIPLLRGVDLERSSGTGNASVLIDEAAAREYFPSEDPLGKLITIYGNWTGTIVGVVGDTRQQRLGFSPPPHVYSSLAANPTGWLKLIVRASTEPRALAAALKGAIQSVDKSVPIDRVSTLRELVSESLGRERFYAILLAVFAACALALTAAGVYGVASYAVARRTRELGLRIALGAERRAVVSLMVRRGVKLAAWGVAVGLVGALATNRLLRGLLFEVEPTDPAMLGFVAVVLVIAMCIAAYLPARRATRVDPMVALRYE